MPIKKRTRRKLTLEESDGQEAWRSRFIELYDRYCDIHESLRIMNGLYALGSFDVATDMCGGLLVRYEKEVEEMVRC